MEKNWGKYNAEDARRLSKGGISVDTILDILRRRNVSKLESVRALVDGMGMSIIEAKKCVHESPVWADVHERDDSIFDL